MQSRVAAQCAFRRTPVTIFPVVALFAALNRESRELRSYVYGSGRRPWKEQEEETWEAIWSRKTERAREIPSEPRSIGGKTEAGEGDGARERRALREDGERDGKETKREK